MTAAMLAGMGAGLGVLLIWHAIFPRRLPLAAALAAMNHPRADRSTIPDAGPTRWASRFGRPFVATLRAVGLPRRAVRDDLAICDRHAEAHVAEQATAALAGLALPPALAGLASLTGMSVPWLAPVWASALLALGGLVLPDMLIRAEARQRRDDFDHALSAFLDLTVITLASGAGVEQALTHAASIGTGWPYEQLRRCLDVAATTRRPLWEPLDDLATNLRVTSVRELAAALRLAGTEGARIRASLTSRAAALRVCQRTAVEARARAASERMSLPVVVLMTGFLVFLTYPALVTVFTDL